MSYQSFSRDLKGLIEAFIFSQSEPVSEKTIKIFLQKNDLVDKDHEQKNDEITNLLLSLQQEYAHRGICLYQVAGGWQFRTAVEWAPYLVKVISKPKRLSRATMETLAVIAYHQPCTRADIEKIRGVSLGQTVLETLLEYSLIKPCGHKAVPGRPTLWATTKDFLSFLGLKDINDLPKREELLSDIPYQSLHDI